MAHAEHHDHDDHDEAHDDHHEPPPPEEPQSPWWLPLLGAAIFLAGGIAFLVMGSDGDEKKAPAEGAAEKPAAVATEQPRPPAPPTRPAVTAIPALRKAIENAGH